MILKTSRNAKFRIETSFGGIDMFDFHNRFLPDLLVQRSNGLKKSLPKLDDQSFIINNITIFFPFRLHNLNEATLYDILVQRSSRCRSEEIGEAAPLSVVTGSEHGSKFSCRSRCSSNLQL